jgi:micrococcal nuclease
MTGRSPRQLISRSPRSTVVSHRGRGARFVALGALATVAIGCAATTEPADPLPVPGPQILAPEGAAMVHRHIDGDSLELEFGNSSVVVEVRLIGINAPELADCNGPAGRDALAALIDGQAIVVSGNDLDAYGRRLVELYVGDLDVNAEMVRSGWALAVHGDGDRLVGNASEAAAAGRGAWDPAAGTCIPRTERIRVVEALANPPGPDEEHLDEELVVLENLGPTAADLEGWILRDESTSNRFTLPDVELAPGARVRVRTGCGTDTADDLYWCSPGPVWSNNGDTALLLGPDGSYVSHLAIG